MKVLTTLPLFLFSAVLLTSCGPPKEVEYRSLKYVDNHFLDPDTGRGFTGIARQKYPDGKIRSEFPFKDGVFHGTVKEWYNNGKPLSETEFKNGERNGKNVEWTEAGLLYRERTYGPGEKILSEKNYEAGK